MNTSRKMPALWGTIVLVMGLLYACSDADSDSTPPILIEAGDITYASIAQDAPGTVTPQSSKTSNFSGLTFSIAPIGTHAGTQVPPIIAEDGTITVAADTSAGSYRVTITPDGSTILGDPFTVDFYVTVNPADIVALDTTLQTAIADYGLTGDFNYIDTSAVTDMSHLFRSGYTPGTGVEESTRTYIASFNGDISKWNVSAVKNFSNMFSQATAFNQGISKWNMSAGTNFSEMFYQATAFNQDIGDWNVSSGENFSGMFEGATAFSQDIGDWTVSAGINFGSMFYQATAFNQNIGGWNVVNGTNFSYMFYGAAAFNQNISGWTVSSGTNFNLMFNGATTFNQDLSGWNVTSTATKTDMFDGSGVVNPESYTWYP